MTKVRKTTFADKEHSPSNAIQIDFIDLTFCNKNKSNIIGLFRDEYYIESDDLSDASVEDTFPLTAYQVNSNYSRRKVETLLKKRKREKNRVNGKTIHETSNQVPEEAKQDISLNDFSLHYINNNLSSASKKCVNKNESKFKNTSSSKSKNISSSKSKNTSHSKSKNTSHSKSKNTSSFPVNLNKLSSAPTNLCFVMDDDDDCILVDDSYVIQREIKKSPIQYESDTESTSPIDNSTKETSCILSPEETVKCNWAMENSDDDTYELPSLSPVRVDSSETHGEKTIKNSKISTNDSCIKSVTKSNTNKTDKNMEPNGITKNITSKEVMSPKSKVKITSKNTAKLQPITKVSEEKEKPSAKLLNTNTEAISDMMKSKDKQAIGDDSHDNESNTMKKTRNIFPVRGTKRKPQAYVDYEVMPYKKMEQSNVPGTSLLDQRKSKINDKREARMTSHNNMKPRNDSSSTVQDSSRMVSSPDSSIDHYHHQSVNLNLQSVDHQILHHNLPGVSQCQSINNQDFSNVNQNCPASAKNITNSVRRNSSDGGKSHPIVNQENRDNSMLIAKATRRSSNSSCEVNVASEVYKFVSYPSVKENILNLRMANHVERQQNVKHSGSVGSDISPDSRISNIKLVKGKVGQDDRASADLHHTVSGSVAQPVESSITKIDMNLNVLSPYSVATAMPETDTVSKSSISDPQIDAWLLLKKLNLINLSSEHLGCLKTGFQNIITKVNALSQPNFKDILLSFLTKRDIIQLLQSCMQILKYEDHMSLTEIQITNIKLAVKGLEDLVFLLKKISGQQYRIDIKKFAHITSQRNNSEILMLFKRIFMFKNHEMPDQNELTKLCKNVVAVQVGSLINGGESSSKTLENHTSVSFSIVDSSSGLTSANSLCNDNSMRILNIPDHVPDNPVAFSSMRIPNNHVAHSTMTKPNSQVIYNPVNCTSYNSTTSVPNNNDLSTVTNVNVTRIPDSVEAKAITSANNNDIQESQLFLTHEDLEKLVYNFSNLDKDSQMAISDYLICLKRKEPAYVEELRKKLSK